MDQIEVGSVIEGEKVAWVIELAPKGTLTLDQQRFILDWAGTVHLVRSVDEALRLVGVPV